MKTASRAGVIGLTLLASSLTATGAAQAQTSTVLRPATTAPHPMLAPVLPRPTLATPTTALQRPVAPALAAARPALVAPPAAAVTRAALPMVHPTLAAPAGAALAPRAVVAPPAEVAEAAPEAPAEVAEAAPTSTPLPVRTSRPLTLAPEPEHAGSGWKFLVVVAGAAGALWYWKRKHPTTAKASNAGLRIVQRAPLGVRSELLVVDAGGQRFLLGVTASSVQHLAVLDAPAEETEAAVAETPAPPDVTSRFEAMLNAARPTPDPERRPRAAASPRRPAEPNPAYGDLIEEQARGLLSLGMRE